MAINLLPPKQKRFARSVYVTHRSIAVLMVCDLLLLSAVVLIVALNITIKQEKSINTRILSSLGGRDQVFEFNKLRDEANLIARYASVAEQSVKEDFLVADYFSQVVAVRPIGLSLNSFDYLSDKDVQTIKLGGVAGNRQGLLNFSSKLESLPWVEDVDSPVTNLVGDDDFIFSLTLTLVKPRL